jgi:hypothetical protein
MNTLFINLESLWNYLQLLLLTKSLILLIELSKSHENRFCTELWDWKTVIIKLQLLIDRLFIFLRPLRSRKTGMNKNYQIYHSAETNFEIKNLIPHLIQHKGLIAGPKTHPKQGKTSIKWGKWREERKSNQFLNRNDDDDRRLRALIFPLFSPLFFLSSLGARHKTG